MSKLETPLTRKYWQKIGGTLVEEFPIVSAGIQNGRRAIDGLIIKDGEQEIRKTGDVNITDKDIILVQTKAKRLGMHLIGQAYISKLLIEKYYKPKSVTSVALCTKGDSVLEELIKEKLQGIEVVVMDTSISREQFRRIRNNQKRT